MRRFHRIVSAIKRTGLKKTIKLSLVEEWLEEELKYETFDYAK